MPAQTTWMNLGMLVVLLLVLYFGFLRPDSKEKKRKQSFQSALKNGDQVYTKAGIYGTVKEINGDLITIETTKTKTMLEVARWAITNPNAEEGRFRTISLNRGE